MRINLTRDSYCKCCVVIVFHIVLFAFHVLRGSGRSFCWMVKTLFPVNTFNFWQQLTIFYRVFSLSGISQKINFTFFQLWKCQGISRKNASNHWKAGNFDWTVHHRCSQKQLLRVFFHGRVRYVIRVLKSQNLKIGCQILIFETLESFNF